MQTVFKILPGEFEYSKTNLFMEITAAGLGYFFQNDEDKSITGFGIFNLDKRQESGNYDVTLKDVFYKEELLSENFNKVFVVFSYNECILTPALHYSQSEEEKNIKLIYGDMGNGVLYKDHITEKNLYATWRIPFDVHSVIREYFNTATVTHQYSLLAKQMQHEAGSLLQVIFYHDKIIVALQKEDKLQMIQSFFYKSAEDVVYHLLNVCKQLNAHDPVVKIFGMIEKESPLYTEIEKYFSVVLFASLPEEFYYNEEIKNFSSHFFSHLFSFATCV